MEGARYRFPREFYWGSATSAYQVEGGIENDWSAWERSEERIRQLKQQGLNPAAFVSGRAADFWNRYEEDLDNAHLLGHTMFRMSIEWSRIEPQEGTFDGEAIAHYRKIIQAVKARGMEPMVTLWHFTNPIWFASKGGFLSKDATRLFTRYAVRLVRALQDDVRYWVTFNEATTVYAWMAYATGQWPPQKKSLRTFFSFRKAILRAHKRAYRDIKAMCHGRCLVGIVENNRAVVGGHWFGAQRLANAMYSHWLWRRIRRENDFIGLNYYTTRRLSGRASVVAKEKGWEVWPEGIYRTIKDVGRFKVPIFITENGIADATDRMRWPFIRDHLSWVAQAMHDGIDVRGYLYWSLLDNFEWEDGYAPRFGLITVDYETQKRTIRPSAHEYAKMIREHAVDLPRSGGQPSGGHRSSH